MYVDDSDRKWMATRVLQGMMANPNANPFGSIGMNEEERMATMEAYCFLAVEMAYVLGEKLIEKKNKENSDA